MGNTKPHMGMLADIVSMLTGQAACATASATADKVASLTGFSLRTGVRVAVTFSNANTVAGALTLNVNGTGAKSIYNEQGAVSATNPATFPAGVSIEFIYDGTNWTYRKYQDEFAKVSGGAPMYACRAWVNFNGSTAVINGSGNVSSVVRNGAGDYTVNFTKAMPDTNYSLTGNCEVEFSVGPYNSSLSSYTTTSARIQTGRYSTGNIDNNVISISIFR